MKALAKALGLVLIFGISSLTAVYIGASTGFLACSFDTEMHMTTQSMWQSSQELISPDYRSLAHVCVYNHLIESLWLKCAAIASLLLLLIGWMRYAR
jgi:hypothetical protein